jgi:hypothetical protein
MRIVVAHGVRQEYLSGLQTSRTLLLSVATLVVSLAVFDGVDVVDRCTRLLDVVNEPLTLFFAHKCLSQKTLPTLASTYTCGTLSTQSLLRRPSFPVTIVAGPCRIGMVHVTALVLYDSHLSQSPVTMRAAVFGKQAQEKQRCAVFQPEYEQNAHVVMVETCGGGDFNRNGCVCAREREKRP